MCEQKKPYGFYIILISYNLAPLNLIKEIMKHRLNLKAGLLMLFFCLITITGKSVKPASGNDIIGIWLTQSKETMIEIKKTGNIYLGIVFWLKNPISQATGKPKVDSKNPDPKLITQPILGLNLLINFTYSPQTKKGAGNIYDPKSGSMYNCIAELVDPNTFKIRGYIGASWMGLGRTEIWKRIK